MALNPYLSMPCSVCRQETYLVFTVAEDVRCFVRARDKKSLNLWSRELFLQERTKIPRE